MERDPTREWHYEKDGDRVGPISERRLDELRELGEISDETLVWADGLSDWRPLRSAFDVKGPAVDPPSPADGERDAVTDEPGEDPDDPLVECAFSGERRPRSRMLPFGEQWVAPEHKDDFIQQLSESGESYSPPLDGYPFAPTLSLEGVFGQAFRIFGAQWREIILFVLCLWGPVYVVIEFLSWEVLTGLGENVPEGDLEVGFSLYMGSIWGNLFLVYGAELLVGSFVAGGVFALTRDRWRGKGTVEFADLFRLGRESFGKVLLTRFMLFCLFALFGGGVAMFGFMAGEVGAIFLFVLIALVLIVFFAIRLTSAESMSLLIGRGGSAAFGKSWSLTKERFWLIFGLRFLLLISVGFATGAFAMIPEIPLPVFQNFFTSAIISTILGIPAAFVSVFEMILSLHLFEKGEKNGGDAGAGS